MFKATIREDGSVLLEDARLIFKNFSGREEKYNPPGRRNFCVLLESPELVEDMIKAGWNVKIPKPRDEEGDELFPPVKVTVGYKVRPPKVVMITSKNRTELDAELIGMLDHATMATVDLIFVPRKWDPNEPFSAYLRTMYVTIREDRKSVV